MYHTCIHTNSKNQPKLKNSGTLTKSDWDFDFTGFCLVALNGCNMLTSGLIILFYSTSLKFANGACSTYSFMLGGLIGRL